MMIDKELLELAAKAAGVEYQCADDGEIIEYLGGGLQLAFGGGKWNPLADDGDALRLAVKLSLLVLPYPEDNAVRITRIDQPDTIVSFGAPSDPCAATRQAIVRAAAEIWRAM